MSFAHGEVHRQRVPIPRATELRITVKQLPQRGHVGRRGGDSGPCDATLFSRVGGPAPPGAEASAVTSAFRRAPRGPRRADFARWGGSDGAVRGQAPPRLMLRANGGRAST